MKQTSTNANQSWGSNRTDDGERVAGRSGSKTDKKGLQLSQQAAEQAEIKLLLEEQ
uniref:Uncharacterized protein n=1 Tax=Setaria digitata TaxID=48799 RepID=A0A915PK07_9BILA